MNKEVDDCIGDWQVEKAGGQIINHIYKYISIMLE